MKIEKSWQLSNSIDEYYKFNYDFNLFLENNNVESGGNFALNVAVEELITNIIKYNPGIENIIINVDLLITDYNLEITIVDNAGAFDINIAEKPDLTKNISELEIGGLGIELVKKLFHSCEYSYVNNNNTVKLVYALQKDD